MGRSFGLLAALALLPAAGAAQDTTRARVDSLAARLQRAEARIRALEAQGTAVDSGAVVRPPARVTVDVRGRILMNAFSNDRRVNSSGGPTYVLPDDPGQLDPRGLAATIRQSSLGFTVHAADVLGAAFRGDVDVDFHGGQLPSTGGRAFALIRMRTATATLTWARTELRVGQHTPLVGGVEPVSLAGLGTPLFSGSGNLWLWMPQIRLSVARPGKIRLAAQGLLGAPTIAAPVGSFETSSFDLAERSRRPFLQGRLSAKWGPDDRQAEVGLAGHTGWYAIARDTLSRGYAAAIDFAVPLASRVAIRGEIYDGKGLRSLGGGGIGQLFGFDGRLIRSRGGWAQLNATVHETVNLGAGVGRDDPNDTDLSATSRLRNDVMASYVHWRPGSLFVVGLEHRRISTTYATRAWANHHLNLAVGFEF